MKYLIAGAFLLLAAPARADAQLDEALEMMSDIYGRLAAIAVTCDIPLEPVLERNILQTVATSGSGSPYARTLLIRKAHAEVHNISGSCDAKLRTEFRTYRGYYDRDYPKLVAAVQKVRGY